MSGTSLDGIDLTYLNFTKNAKWNYEILAAETIPYTREWEKTLAEAVFYNDLQLKELNENYTNLLAEVIPGFLKRHKIKEIDAVCSHGHTVKHEPENSYTLQIGNLPQLAKKLGQKIVCDFRVQDVELGGQGAPLVPIGDELLFPEYDYCLNLGGFANVSTRINNLRVAYDICPVNTVLNNLASRLNLAFDRNGEIAASGKIEPVLLEKLNSLDFYRQKPPKSLGIEWVNKHILPFFEDTASVTSALKTYTVHAAEQIARVLGQDPRQKVLVTGGGAFNTYLMEEIAKRTRVKVVIPSAEVINFKEALIFGFLGVLRLRNEINVLSSVTGASRDHSSGQIYLP